MPWSFLVQSLDRGHGDAIVHQGQLLCRLPHEHLVGLDHDDLLSQVAEVLGDQALDPRFPRACRGDHDCEVLVVRDDHTSNSRLKLAVLVVFHLLRHIFGEGHH